MIRELRSQLGVLEGSLNTATEKEVILAKELAEKEVLQAKADKECSRLQRALAVWTDELTNIATRLSSQLAVMDMKSWGFTVNRDETASVRLSKFFEGLIDALQTYHADRDATTADEAHQFGHDVVYEVLTRVVHRNPSITLVGTFKALPVDADLAELDRLVAPIANKILEIPHE